MSDFQFPTIDDSWTLFLDRDGVLNRRLVGDYVKSPDELEVLEGVKEAVDELGTVFGRIVVVTNQRGIALRQMTEGDLEKVRIAFLARLGASAPKIDAIYYCPHDRHDGCDCRKPGPGMAHQAQGDFPEIDFNKSIIVGDADSDMQFGRNLGMVCVWIDTGAKDKIPTDFDLKFYSLHEFAEFVKGTLT